MRSYAHSPNVNNTTEIIAHCCGGEYHLIRALAVFHGGGQGQNLLKPFGLRQVAAHVKCVDGRAE